LRRQGALDRDVTSFFSRTLAGVAKEDHAAVEAAVRAALAAQDLARAATAAIRGYGPQIFSYLVTILRAESDANEVFSIFCEELWKSLPGFRGDASCRTWAYKIAWHAALRFKKDPHRRRGRRLMTDEVSGLADQVRSTTALHLRTEAKDKIGELRKLLDPDEQTLLVLRVNQKLSWTEVAGVMSTEEEPVDEAALRKRFERVKAKLQKAAERRGLLPK
jgi:RNA polymerase sigma-70 factor (ECF subfamily)